MFLTKSSINCPRFWKKNIQEKNEKKKKQTKMAKKTIEILQNQAQNSVTVNCIGIYTGAIKNESEYCHQTRLKYDLSERERERTCNPTIDTKRWSWNHERNTKGVPLS